MKLTTAIALTLITAFLLALLLACEDRYVAPTKVCPDCPPPIHQISLSLNRTDWHLSARPAQIDQNMPRARMLWHIPWGGIPYDSVFTDNAPNHSATIPYLRLIVRPNDSVAYYRPTAAAAYWAGITYYIGSRFPDTAQMYLELRVRGNHGVLHIDLGRISEDAFGDKYPREEHVAQNGFFYDSLDVGLDALPDMLEPGYDLNTNPDPSHDNWFFDDQGKPPVPYSVMNSSEFRSAIYNPDSPIFYEWINGTEGNYKDPNALGLPDREQLGPSFNLDDSYLSFHIDLSSSRLAVPGSEFNGWVTYRVNLAGPVDLDTIVGLSDYYSFYWPAATHLRFWFEKNSSEIPDTVGIAAIRFVPWNQ